MYSSVRAKCLILAGLACVLLVFVQAAPAEIIAAWDIDDGAGTTVTKTVGPADGTINGAGVAWQTSGPPSMPNDSLYFPGTVGNYVDFGTSSTLSPSSITVGFWAKAESGVTYQNMAMVSKYSKPSPRIYEFAWSNATYGDNLMFKMYYGASYTGNFHDVYAGDNHPGSEYTGSDFEADGGWHFIVGTYDQTTGLASLYLDGNLVGDNSHDLSAGQPLTPASNSLYMGQRPYAGAEVPYQGYLGGEFFIRDDAMSAADVKAYYNSVVPEPSTLALLAAGLIGLLAYAWRKRK